MQEIQYSKTIFMYDTYIYHVYNYDMKYNVEFFM